MPFFARSFPTFRATLILALVAAAALSAAPTVVRAIEVDQLPIKLGDAYEDVKQAYQTTLEPEPFQSVNPGMTALRLKTKGVWFFFDRSGKISTIRLDAPFKSAVAGVKIGDTYAKMTKVLGKPAKAPAPLTSLSARNYFYYPDDETTLQFVTVNNSNLIETIFISK